LRPGVCRGEYTAVGLGRGTLRRARRPGGFTLIELLIVVAIIGIIAAIAIPGLLRARVSANESAGIGDIRTVLSAQAAYFSANGSAYEGNLVCLASPFVGCIPTYPPNGPIFLDSHIASRLPKGGYTRSFSPSPLIPNLDLQVNSPTSVWGYVYTATPIQAGMTGVRGFAGDSTGSICYSRTGALPPHVAFRLDTSSPDCRVIR